MKTLFIPFVFLTLLTVTVGSSQDDQPGLEQGFVWRWDYPHSKSVNQLDSADSTANLILRTDDPIEKVILWYAKQTALPTDHPLVKSAETGFHKISTTSSIDSTFRHSSALTGHTSVMGDFSATHAHVTLIFQPNRDRTNSVVISITKCPEWTSIHVQQQRPDAG